MQIAVWSIDNLCQREANYKVRENDCLGTWNIYFQPHEEWLSQNHIICRVARFTCQSVYMIWILMVEIMFDFLPYLLKSMHGGCKLWRPLHMLLQATQRFCPTCTKLCLIFSIRFVRCQYIILHSKNYAFLRKFYVM